MNVRTLFALTVVALLLTAGTATAVVIGSPDIDASIHDSPISNDSGAGLLALLAIGGYVRYR